MGRQLRRSGARACESGCVSCDFDHVLRCPTRPSPPPPFRSCHLSAAAGLWATGSQSPQRVKIRVTTVDLGACGGDLVSGSQAPSPPPEVSPTLKLSPNGRTYAQAQAQAQVQAQAQAQAQAQTRMHTRSHAPDHTPAHTRALTRAGTPQGCRSLWATTGSYADGWSWATTRLRGLASTGQTNRWQTSQAVRLETSLLIFQSGAEQLRRFAESARFVVSRTLLNAKAPIAGSTRLSGWRCGGCGKTMGADWRT